MEVGKERGREEGREGGRKGGRQANKRTTLTSQEKWVFLGKKKGSYCMASYFFTC